ncbi:RSP_2648 family PIN domain-containing protein [Paracoccus seriniphilus]|uniref:PIN domain-containing protein n=1 Tax=Paracoccus seriniphilus TaxID=184748 RepID=A0A239PXG1_9RHOB|nr:PIN domain-containing protein [Paracoccus seriniphilus]WCR13122.1 PIN domain-containing protein [Paracoccus seriniphilus]SNT74622.1 PIN domain-containing protein [Paracoccus seriniphilus]
MRAVLDANVLFPTVLREILIEVATGGLFQPVWSQRILDEWRHAAGRLGREQELVAGAEIALLSLRFPDAMAAHDGQRAIDLDLPDAADRHVIEAALHVSAPHIVTANLRDFPRHVMQGLGLRAIHPDAFLLELIRLDEALVAQAITRVHAKAVEMGGDIALPQMLKRSRLPRLAKLMKG